MTSPDAHRARLGVNYTQIPVNAPVAPVHAYSKDGIGRVRNVTDPVYFPNSKAGTLVRDVMDDAARDRLVGNIVGALLAGVTEPVLQRAFWYLGNVDKELGERVETGVRTGQA